jgi:hypothetical protein
MVQGLEFMVWLAKLARGQPKAKLNLASLEDAELLLGEAGWSLAPHSVPPTILMLKCWVRGTCPPTSELERPRNGAPK